MSLDGVLRRIFEPDLRDVPEDLRSVLRERLRTVEETHVGIRRVDAIGIIGESMVIGRNICFLKPCEE